MSKKIEFFVLVILIFAMPLAHSVNLHSENGCRDGSALKLMILNAPLHTLPINITSDLDFIGYGFLGNGTEESPYIIENFDIVTSSDVGISIKDTTKHFIIQNGSVDAFRMGINIKDVAENTTIIRNCICFANTEETSGYGIRLTHSDYSIIRNNTCFGNEYGIYIALSNYVQIKENKCYSNEDSGMKLSDCYNLRVLNNSFTSNYDPFLPDYSFRITPGLSLLLVFFSVIEENYFSNNSVGIYATFIEFCNITNNQFVDNEEHGVSLQGSNYNLIHHNKFVMNNIDGESQAYDYRKTNMWYDNITQRGNHWSNFKSNGLSYKYKLDGGDVFDPYPLNENLESYEHIYSNLILVIVSITYLILLSIFTYYRVKKRIYK